MAFGFGPRVLKHCAQGHVVQMAWRTCPRCTGNAAPQKPAGRDMVDQTVVFGVSPVQAPERVAAPRPDWVALFSASAGPAAGHEYAILPGRWKLGRAPRVEDGFQVVAVPDPSMSRDHFALEAGVAAVVLRDLGSTNGTHVNGSRVDRHILAEGDVVRAGETSFRVQLSLGRPSS
jgi:hypothetical protein